MRNRARSDADYKVKNWDRHSQVNLSVLEIREVAMSSAPLFKLKERFEYPAPVSQEMLTPGICSPK